jgi:hypothetical protein
VGLIAFSTLEPLLAEKKEERKSNPFLYHATNRVKDPQLHDKKEMGLYRGSSGEWQAQFAITQPVTRRNQLKALIHHMWGARKFWTTK